MANYSLCCREFFLLRFAPNSRHCKEFSFSSFVTMLWCSVQKCHILCCREFGAEWSRIGKSEKQQPNFRQILRPKNYAVKIFCHDCVSQTIYALLICDGNIVPKFHRKMSKKQGFRNLFRNPIFQHSKLEIYQNSFENPEILKFFEVASPRPVLFLRQTIKSICRITTKLHIIYGLTNGKWNNTCS